MKYVADRGYTDLKLKRHVDKGENLEEIYKKVEVELTEERKKYLIEERKLYVSVDEIPEGEKAIDRVDIIEEEGTIEDNKEEVLEDNKEDKTKNNNKRTTKTSSKNEEK